MRLILLTPLLFVLPVHAESPPLAPRDLTEDQLIASLIDGLDDGDVEVRINLGMALGQLGAKSLGPLIIAVEQGGPNRRAGAAYALSQLRGSGRPALPALVRALKAQEEVVRRNASYAILRIIGTTGDAPATTETLKPILPPLDPVPASVPQRETR